jgi:hypothetical protein
MVVGSTMWRRAVISGRNVVRAVPWKGVVGVAVATPIVAIVQGTILLQGMCWCVLEPLDFLYFHSVGVL